MNTSTFFHPPQEQRGWGALLRGAPAHDASRGSYQQSFGYQTSSFPLSCPERNFTDFLSRRKATRRAQSLTFLVSSLLLILCWQQDRIPQGIIKGSLLPVPRLTSRRPLRVISARPHLPPPHALVLLSKTETLLSAFIFSACFPPNLLSALIFFQDQTFFFHLGQICRMFVVFARALQPPKP